MNKVMLDEAAMSILDLRELPSSRFRIVGSAYWVTDAGRYKHSGTEYLLVREPKNKWDVNAVAVYGMGRKIGHLTEAKAASLAPIFDELGFGAYRVGGAAPAPNSIRMWVDLPTMPKLRAFAKSVGTAAG
ncbi:HIRAN domain-containing protein [Pseudarthrobacter sp. LMD1-1-1.1]|uniref:HIRAN domain-containing protein n=1 Tax=Pseudarthrobacter sp. LMD1-1-1.1 TaxID=3135242 RepID=UPI0034168586